MYNLHRAGAVLTIDVGAVVENWQILSKITGKAECAAVVKTDAYGLGANHIGPALSWAGCKTFFVANVEEGMELRQCLGNQNIFILHGNYSNTEAEFFNSNLIPVLNNPKQIKDWSDFAVKKEKKLPAAIHIDTGMSRLGLTEEQFAQVINDPSLTENIIPVMLMSHLACADEKDNPKNLQQKNMFSKALQKTQTKWENTVPCFANSAGIFLGNDYHYSMVRPGIALYGSNPCPYMENPMRPAVKLQGKILQIQEVDTPQTVGYGATYRVPAKAKIATVAVGYGDGFLRSAGNRAFGYIEDYKVPMVGRVSMDLVTFDVSGVPERLAQTGGYINLIDTNNTVDDVASAAGTIGYEILTNLGKRYFRRYIGEEL